MGTRQITIFHSPDADDAFMFYGLTSGKVGVEGYDFLHELCDIETLNQRCRRGEVEVSALSVHAYAHVAQEYVLLRSGASMGGADYGPKLVVKGAHGLASLEGKKIAIPGAYTSATLALKLFLAEHGIGAELEIHPFDEVQHRVADGSVAGGVIIHEGQLTYGREGFQCVADLGQWWWEKHALPLPLGVNVAKRALGETALRASAKVLKETIEFSLAHRDEAIAYALSYGRGITADEADVFVGMYVNERTVDIGADGIESIRLFLKAGMEAGFVPAIDSLEVVDADGIERISLREEVRPDLKRHASRA